MNRYAEAAAALPWTDEMTQRLVELLDQGLSRSAAAEILGVTRNAAIGRAYRIGYTRGGHVTKQRGNMLKAIDQLYQSAMLCKIQNNNCPAPPVIRHHNTSKCATHDCNNTRLPGYMHGLCNICNHKRLTMAKEAA